MGKSRNINFVSVILVVLFAAVGFVGWKLAPVFWQRAHVDTELAKIKFEASKIHLRESDDREVELLEQLQQGIIDLGVQEQHLNVYFSPDYTAIHADYSVVVTFPFDYQYHFDFQRQETIPRDGEY